MRDTGPAAAMEFETDQRVEVRQRFSLGARTTVVLHSVRCREAQEQNLLGQDYARIIARTVGNQGTQVAFCVCDGVGSSYRGDFAARYLGLRLVEWLFALNHLPERPQTLTQDLCEQMAWWSHAAQQELLAAGRPRAGSALEREVLEEMRDHYGSESVFLAGRVDRDGSAGGEGAPVDILLCWMGNVQAHMRTGQRRPQTFAAMDDDRARWSTVRGVYGELSVRRIAARTPCRLVIHTDGLAALGEAICAMSENDLSREEQRLLGLPANDDMTLLALDWPGNIGQTDDEARLDSRAETERKARG